MIYLILLGLGAAVLMLWNRVDRLERQLASLREAAWLPLAIEPAAPPEDVPHTAAEPEPVAAPAPTPQLAMPLLREPDPAFPDDDAMDERRDESAPVPARKAVDLEDLFGRVLPIWAGGLTLAVAGLFVIRFSIEAGLLTPAVRVVLGFAFGLLLLGGAEAAFRAEARVADPRVRQALAGAGIATLYAGFYLAGNLYGLIGPGAAFAGLALVTAAAIGLSHRFGTPSAVLGLVGGFAAPLLVDSDGGNVPLLATYLALLTAGLMGSARARRWSWLGIGALAGGLAWGVLLLLGGAGSPGDLAAAGGFIILVGVLLPGLLAPLQGRWRRVIEGGAAGVAALQMGALVTRAQFGPLAWGMLALLASALAVLGWRNPALRRASGFAALLVPVLLLVWGEPTLPLLAGVVAVFAVLLAGVPLALVWRGRHNWLDAAQIAAAALGLWAAFALQAGGLLAEPDGAIAAAGLALAAFPLLACWRLWPAAGQGVSFAALGLAASAMALLFAGVGVLVPVWTLTLLAAALTLGWLLLARGRADGGMLALGWAGALVSVVLLVGQAGPDEFGRLGGAAGSGADGLAALRWLGAAAVAALLALLEHRAPHIRLAEGAAALLLYGAGAQVLPPPSLAWFAALAGVALLWTRPVRLSAALTFAGIALAWALPPLGAWFTAAFLSLLGEPVLASAVPGSRDVALRLVPLLVPGAALVARRALSPEHRALGLALTGGLAAVIAHSLFKQALGIADGDAFARAGLLERTVWQALLLGAALLAWRWRARAPSLRTLALVLGGAAFGHWFLYTLLLHNPLWSMQAVGPLPLGNLLLPAYAIGLGCVLWARGGIDWPVRWARPALDGAAMAFIALLVLSLLRQLFSGTFLLATPVAQTESLLQSLAGIVLAGAFLWRGARTGERLWRAGSLVAALATVGKVFLHDAAALDGFGRIASFAALGFSLIGIGWFYSRQLRR